MKKEKLFTKGSILSIVVMFVSIIALLVLNRGLQDELRSEKTEHAKTALALTTTWEDLQIANTNLEEAVEAYSIALNDLAETQAREDELLREIILVDPIVFDRARKVNDGDYITWHDPSSKINSLNLRFEGQAVREQGLSMLGSGNKFTTYKGESEPVLSDTHGNTVTVDTEWGECVVVVTGEEFEGMASVIFYIYSDSDCEIDKTTQESELKVRVTPQEPPIQNDYSAELVFEKDMSTLFAPPMVGDN